MGKIKYLWLSGIFKCLRLRAAFIDYVMNEQDIRWEQRFSNYKKALGKLEEAVNFIKHDTVLKEQIEERENITKILNDLIKQGLIQSFEYTHEMAWNVMKDYAAYQGNAEVRGSRDASREAFAMGLIADGEVWMEMIRSGNKTSHTYNEEIADEIFNNILGDYFHAFKAFKDKMEEIKSGEQGSLFYQ